LFPIVFPFSLVISVSFSSVSFFLFPFYPRQGGHSNTAAEYAVKEERKNIS